MKTTLRQASAADCQLLQQLDELCIDEGWSVNLWQTMLANPKRYRAWLLQRGETVVGYALYAQVLDEAELLRIGVRPDSQGQGLGLRLLAQTRQMLQAQGGSHLHLEVRESNTAAQALYRKDGWRRSGRRRNYYPAEDGSEDALLFSLGSD